MSKLAKELGEIVCDILERLILSERPVADDAKRTFLPGHEVLWGCDYHFVHEIAERTEPGARYYLDDTAAEYVKLYWPIDVGTVFDRDSRWVFNRVATVDYSEIRGKVKIVPKYCVTSTSGWLEDDGSWTAETTICGLVAGRWTIIQNDTLRSRTVGLTGNTVSICVKHNDTPEQVDMSVRTAFAARLTERYSWHVAFGFCDDGPRIVVPTSPDGCLELFKKRDLSPGEQRRAALRHWVNSHYRDLPNAQFDMTYVREHLRGNTRFIWSGLDCELMVSEFDLEKNEFFRQQAAEWRAMRKHNRVRLRTVRG